MSEFNLHSKEETSFLFKLIAPETISFDTFYFCDIPDGANYLGNQYQYLEYLEIKGLNYAIGKSSTPTLSIGDTGLVGLWVSTFNSLLNFEIHIKRINKANLSNQNPVYQTPFDVYKIAQKSNFIPGGVISWKLRRLASLNSKIPGRVLNANCTWKIYRGAGCNYQGDLYFDSNNNPVSDKSQDICALTLEACKLRTNSENFSGIPTIDSF
ncbi:MAG: hypothetical protein AAF316_00120 [Cyanobacteria bacterium P01_A01_bin.80]